MRLFVHPGASADIREQARYYETIEPGLGAAFLDEVDSAVNTIVSMPKAFPLRRKNLRMFVLQRFPFSLLYRFEADLLEVLVVRHHARHENYGEDRL